MAAGPRRQAAARAKAAASTRAAEPGRARDLSPGRLGAKRERDLGDGRE